MAHYAQVNSDKIVVQVLVMDNDMETNDGEAACISQYAGIGYTYDSSKDKFISPQPFASWALDSSDDWQAPVAMPSDASDDKRYLWDEDVYQADNSKGWVVEE